MGTLGQHPHLVRHHGEAAALLAGPGGLDGGVQRQQVGLLGDALDGGEDGVDLLGVLLQLLDDAGGLLDLGGEIRDGALVAGDHLLAVLTAAGAAAGCLRGLLGIAGDLDGGGGHLVHRGRNLGDLVLLARQPLVGFLRHVVGGPGLLVELGGGVGDVLHHDVDAFDEGVDVLGDGADLVFPLDLDAAGQIAVATGEIRDGVAEGLQGARSG